MHQSEPEGPYSDATRQIPQDDGKAEETGQHTPGDSHSQHNQQVKPDIQTFHYHSRLCLVHLCYCSMN
jgi:hypothetical protein